MVDLFLQKFYNDVKDPGWPIIDDYSDYVKLPDHIKLECQTQHNIQQRFEEIYNPNYWQQLTQFGYQFENLIYVPVLKCAHNYYTKFFRDRLGWKKVDLRNVDTASSNMFGLIMHPFSRHLKGMTQWFWEAYEYSDSLDQLDSDLSKPHIMKLLGSTILGDSHVVPYSFVFGNLLNQINWIPIDNMSDEDIMKNVISFCEKHNCKITPPTDIERSNTSSVQKLKLYNIIKSIFYNQKIDNNEKIHILYYLYSEDLRFYQNLIDKSNPTR